MSDTTLDVLVHLLTNYFQDDCTLPLPEAELRDNLRTDGFEDHTIQKAFLWLDHLQELPEAASSSHPPLYRMTEPFFAYEKQRLDESAQAFLRTLLLGQTISLADFECVMSQAMLLELKHRLHDSDIKAIVMLVLFHSKNASARGSLAQLEKTVLTADGSIGVH